MATCLVLSETQCSLNPLIIKLCCVWNREQSLRHGTWLHAIHFQCLDWYIPPLNRYNYIIYIHIHAYRHFCIPYKTIQYFRLLYRDKWKWKLMRRKIILAFERLFSVWITITFSIIIGRVRKNNQIDILEPDSFLTL